EALGHPDGRLSKHLKESLIKQAEALGVPVGMARMSEADEKAVDLVDEVFTQNLYERKLQDAARTILAQMLFPSVKAAILNRRWFAEEEHPRDNSFCQSLMLAHQKVGRQTKTPWPKRARPWTNLWLG